MKKLILIVIAMLNLCLYGQNFTLKLKFLPEQYGKSINKEAVFLNRLNQNQILSFEKSYPNAKNPELLKFYTLKGKGINKELIKELYALDLFETIVAEDSFEIAGCTNPLPPVNDTWIAQNWVNNYALELIEANCAWSISKGSSDIFIGIADTEFELTHDDLKHQITKISGPSSANHRHGTQVSGLAAAETNNNVGIAGIGYNSKIAAHRIPHTSSGSASAFDIRTAIWNLYLDTIPIVNVSWTGTGLDVAAAQEITQNGTVLVLAAGNKPTDTNHKEIANIPGVILVSSVDQNNEHGPSNHAHNQWVDLCLFSFLRITSGALISISRFKRLFLIITLR